MNLQNEAELVRKYPKIFKNYWEDEKTASMCWGFECEDGWFKIIDEACAQLQRIADLEDVQVVATQVKEKWGTIRFYYRFDFNEDIDYSGISEGTYDRVDEIIEELEENSTYTCEHCGAKTEGTTRLYGWVYNVCAECEKLVHSRYNDKNSFT